MKLVRRLLAVLILVVSPPAFAQQKGQGTPSSPPPFVERGLPGPAHEALQPLVGTWRVEKSLYIAGGTPEKPLTSQDIICRRDWLADGRFLRDETQGKIGASPYWRLGLLGYSNMDKRYEWVTIDGLNANMMIYLGEPGSGSRRPIVMTGTFTDQGLISKNTVGKPVKQRVVIRIEGDDRHVMELYFTPPGEAEILADRSVYTRMKSE